MKGVQAMFFDVFGTLVDWRTSVAREAKRILAASEVEWQRIAPRIGVRDDDALAVYRQRYSEGIVRRPLPEEEDDARALYRVLAEIGGSDLVGPAREMPQGTFYRPASGRRAWLPGSSHSPC